MLRRAVQDPAVQGGEWSMAQYLYRIDKGDHRYVGLPIFPLRNFTARDSAFNITCRKPVRAIAAMRSFGSVCLRRLPRLLYTRSRFSILMAGWSRTS
jgi:hypothetical protein